ncbi:hypothetical protein DM01DRAFT_1287811, partial [Hesseltinella vesiculosa]
MFLVKHRTAQRWVADFRKELNEDNDTESERKKVGRPQILGEPHQSFLKTVFDDNPSTTMEDAVSLLTQEFEGLEIKRSAVRNFVTQKMHLTFKRVSYQPEARNKENNLTNRFNWATEWTSSDMNYMTNCVFIDEAAFSINLRPHSGYAKKG